MCEGVSPKAQCLYHGASAGSSFEDAGTILDALFWVYSESACDEYDENLNHLLYGLPTERINTIIDTVNDLCWEHERRGFINGFKLGMRLEREISQ